LSARKEKAPVPKVTSRGSVPHGEMQASRFRSAGSWEETSVDQEIHATAAPSECV
jgi:hypothetical protein